VDTRAALPAGTILDGSYRIARVVGSGGFGITYEAEDINLGTAVAIKEYYPFDVGDRDATMSVKPKSDRHKPTFDWGRSNFLQEARTLARFEHPSVVRVTRAFEANSTAYMVMRFERGHSFEAWLNGLGRLPTQEELDSIVAPLLDALQMMHAENFLHRDIAPDNIIVRADGSPVLLDFGAARRAVAEMSRTMTGIVKAGYSPHEQYSSDSRLQGPWSDLYALGGTLYRAVTGHEPEEATLRVDEDHMPPASQVARKSGYRPGFLSAIDTCLRVRHSERARSVAQLRPMMLGRTSQPRPGLRFVEALKAPGKTPPLRAPPRPPSRRGTTPPTGQPGAVRRWPVVVAAILAILGGAYGGYEYTRWQPIDAADAQRRAAQVIAAERADEERARQEAEAKRLAEAAAAQKRADEERARQEAEAKRVAEAAAAQKRADEERARQEAEAKRVAEAAAAQKRADEERARQEAEAKRVAEAAAKKRADEEAAAAKARTEAEARRIAEEAAQRQATADLQRRQKAEAEAELSNPSKNFFRDCDNCPDLVVVPAGQFLMGSSNEDIDSGIAAANEAPQRNILIRHKLAVGRFEVTRDEFEAFVRASAYRLGNKCWTLEGNEPKERDNRSFRDPGYTQLGTHPVVCVSWDDAKAYTDWLSKTTGKAYRLPSESEWEYVARAGTTMRFPVANTEADLCGYGNGADQTARSAALPPAWNYLSCRDGFAHTAPVGSFKPNAFGIFDLMGNAWEWVEDCYIEKLGATPSDGQPSISANCQRHTVRGGSWSAPARMLRVAARGGAPANSRFDDVGFRVVRTMAPAE
jgi:formylglycine-generating enzyme required for sulfatase activity